MKNVVITIAVIIGVFFLITIFDSDRTSTATSDYEDEYYSLQSCLDEWKEAHEEYKQALDDTHYILENVSEGGAYDDLVSAIDDARVMSDVYDNSPSCD